MTEQERRERLHAGVCDAIEGIGEALDYVDTLDFALLGMERMDNANINGRCPALPVVAALSRMLTELSARLTEIETAASGEGAS